MLEVFRTLVSNNFKPNRTVEFHFYAYVCCSRSGGGKQPLSRGGSHVCWYWRSAEEVGLKGSQEIAETYYKQNKVVVGMMQLDMTYVSRSLG